MKSYYEELMNLKNQITQLREFGAFDNLNDVGNMVSLVVSETKKNPMAWNFLWYSFVLQINQQRDKLFELTKRQEEYDEKLQTKENEIKRLVESMTEQEHVLNKKEKEIKMLNEKEEEHMNIINLLHNKLELRNEADIDVIITLAKYKKSLTLVLEKMSISNRVLKCSLLGVVTQSRTLRKNMSGLFPAGTTIIYSIFIESLALVRGSYWWYNIYF